MCLICHRLVPCQPLLFLLSGFVRQVDAFVHCTKVWVKLIRGRSFHYFCHLHSMWAYWKTTRRSCLCFRRRMRFSIHTCNLPLFCVSGGGGDEVCRLSRPSFDFLSTEQEWNTPSLLFFLERVQGAACSGSTGRPNGSPFTEAKRLNMSQWVNRRQSSQRHWPLRRRRQCWWG